MFLLNIVLPHAPGKVNIMVSKSVSRRRCSEALNLCPIGLSP